MSNYQPLKGISDIHEYTLTSDLQDSLVEYFDWALLDIGNYFNVTSGELSADGNDYSKLRPGSNDIYPSGTIWEGFRKNWVWQSGVSYSPSPLVSSDDANPGVSGVYVNGDFHPVTSTGTYSHYIDHYNGKVIFNSPIPTGSTVQVEHSYKWINVIYASELPWLREIQESTNAPDSSFFDTNKGRWNIPPESRLQLPAIAIEVVPNRRFQGYQLGGGQIVYTDVLFHCIAEDVITRDKLLDIVSLQNDKTIYLFNSNEVSNASAYPLDYLGVPVSGAKRFPDLVSSYPGGKYRLTNATTQKMIMIGSDIFGGIVRFRTEGFKNNI